MNLTPEKNHNKLKIKKVCKILIQLLWQTANAAISLLDLAQDQCGKIGKYNHIQLKYESYPNTKKCKESNTKIEI